MLIRVFKLFLEVDGKKCEFDMRNFFNQVGNLSENLKLIDIEGFPVQMNVTKEFPDATLGISFFKFRRNYRPYIKTDDGEVTPITNDVIEVVSLKLNHDTNTMCLEFNMHGIREKGIEKYLNHFTKTLIPDRKCCVRVERLYADLSLNKIFSSRKIKYVEPIFSANEFINYGTPEIPLLEGVNNFLSKNIESSPIVKLQMVPSLRNKTLDGESVKELIEMTENLEERGNLIDFKVCCEIDGKMQSKSIYDLRGQLNFSLIFSDDSPGLESVLDQIYANYEGDLKAKVYSLMESENSSLEDMED